MKRNNPNGAISNRTSDFLHRRHLTAGQKAAIAAEALPHFETEAKKRQVALAGTRKADLTEKIPEGIESREQAAKQVGVNPRYVSDAKKIKEAAPETFEKLKAGEGFPNSNRIALPPAGATLAHSKCGRVNLKNRFQIGKPCQASVKNSRPRGKEHPETS